MYSALCPIWYDLKGRREGGREGGRDGGREGGREDLGRKGRKRGGTACVVVA